VSELEAAIWGFNEEHSFLLQLSRGSQGAVKATAQCLDANRLVPVTADY
jgi:hypothetical protein